MWYCNDRYKHIYPLKIICLFDVKGMKGGWENVIITKVLMRSIERATIIVNITHLLVNRCTLWKSIYLYNAVYHVFVFPGLNNIRRYKSFF